MALQSSGTITIQDIVDEFGGTAPHSLSEYYRGGAYVGSNNTGVPTSGTISLSDFYGATAAITVLVSEGTGNADGLTTNYGFISGYNKVYNPSTNAFATNPVLTGTNRRSPTTLYGNVIANISRATTKGSTSFVVVLEGTVAKTGFTSVTPQGGVLLTTASASYYLLNNSNPSYSKASVWEWPSTSFTMPTGWDGTGTRTATFV